MTKGKIRRKVVLIFGDYKHESCDFVLEPPCYDDCKCDVCKDSFWIEIEEKI